MAKYYKYPPKISEMSPGQLEWEIDRLRAQISEQPINDSGAFRYKQRSAVIKLGEIRDYLSSLAAHLPSEP